jgi:hypothetical protein
MQFFLSCLPVFLFCREYLTEQQVSSSKVTLFANLYNLNQDSLKYSLASTGFFFPHIVDVSWRADFTTKTNETQDQVKSDVAPKIYIKYVVILACTWFSFSD